MAPALNFKSENFTSTDVGSTVDAYYTTTATTPYNQGFLETYIWVPIVGGILLVVIICLLVFAIRRYRHHQRYDYTAIRDEQSLPLKLEMEKQLQIDAARESALLNTMFYLRSMGSYKLLHHLPEIGSREGKQWFRVTDLRVNQERLLIICPRSAHMLLPFTGTTKTAVSDLLGILQHPYIYPTHDVDFIMERDQLVIVQGFNQKGSLKDAIYDTVCSPLYNNKYSHRGRPLLVPHIQLYGRQILEALLYLEEQGFTPFGHLHSGNVMLDNGRCRLTGLENSLLSLTPKLFTLLRGELTDNRGGLDSLCFGHLLFEMAAGYEMSTAKPLSWHLGAITNPKVKEVIRYIFPSKKEAVPSLKQIADQEFFSVALTELHSYNPPPVNLSKSMKAILKAIRKGKPLARLKSRRGTTANKDETRVKKRFVSDSPSVNTTEVSVLPRSESYTSLRSTGSKGSRGSKASRKSGKSSRTEPETPRVPAPPPPPTAVSLPAEATTTERTALLSEIRQGLKLKNTHPLA